jgi:hypothetical protein
VKLDEALDLPPTTMPSSSSWSATNTTTSLNAWKRRPDEPTRQLWLADRLEYQLPDHVDPPYDRDRHLPPYEDRALDDQ